ncbi:MAG TPA: TonB-dependent receptor [Terracidiphilus sp.]
MAPKALKVWMKALPLILLLSSAIALGQVNRGEIRLRVVDPAGSPVRAFVEIVSIGNGFDEKLTTDASGRLDARLLPFGTYQLKVNAPNLAADAELIEIRSGLPAEKSIQLGLPRVNTEVEVTGAGTLLDANSPSSAMQIGGRQVHQRLSSLPGRSVQDLVLSQPGWLYEGNAVLHPRGSEYQTQFVIDGIPLTDNRSPGFGPEIEADDLQSVTIFTAGFPAEYGRKLGGVIELNTQHEPQQGLHGETAVSGGSYDTASSYARLQDVHAANSFNVTAAGSMTDHFLNPVVPQNYTNTGTSGDFSAQFERELNSKDRIKFTLRRELTRFLIPNELIQQKAGQLQNGDSFETMETANYQQILSPESLFTMAGMARQNSHHLYSNRNPTPIAVFQDNSFREGYFKATYSRHHGHQEFKAGLDSDAVFLRENFRYVITEATQFDPGTPPSLSFTGARPDLEQSAFVEDQVHLDKWTLDAGLRWDHYQLLLNRQALSPRFAIGRYFPALKMAAHGSYDRIFQTPSSDNILLSSSAQVDALSSQFLRLPVQPSRGNDFELGITKAFADRVRLDANVYRRDARNFADDDQLLNTGVSYPIAFDKATIYGAEGKLQVTKLGNLNGFVSYSYMVGNAWFPVTGGLFLGQGVSSAVTQLSGHFPDSQDQRNTADTQFTYKIAARAWVGTGASYGSGLPFDFGGTQADAFAEYGSQVVSRLNFDRGRIRPLLAVTASAGADVFKHDRVQSSLRVDGENLNNRLNVLDFNGLFSGNAIAPARSFLVRWDTRF